MRIRGCAVAVAACLTATTAAACARPRDAVHVGFLFGNNWVLGPVTLTSDEQARIKSAAFATLAHAFEGFAIDFAEDGGRDRIIRLNRYLFGSGSTQIGSKVSLVNLDGVHLTLLAVTGCHDIAACAAYPRAALVDALGRGIGATAAHELGHQAGLEFTRERNCDDCYDGVTSKARVHFFGEKHWSADAMTAMRRVLPDSH